MIHLFLCSNQICNKNDWISSNIDDATNFHIIEYIIQVIKDVLRIIKYYFWNYK